MFVTCYNEKVTYLISKSRTFLDNPSVIPSTQRKNMKIYMNQLWELDLEECEILFDHSPFSGLVIFAASSNFCLDSDDTSFPTFEMQPFVPGKS